MTPSAHTPPPALCFASTTIKASTATNMTLIPAPRIPPREWEHSTATTIINARNKYKRD